MSPQTGARLLQAMIMELRVDAMEEKILLPEQIKFLENFSMKTVSHPDYESAKLKIFKSIEQTLISKKPNCMVLVGKPGVGKTSVCMKVVERYGGPSVVQEPNGVFTVVPAFYCPVPSSLSIKSLAEEMLRGLGCTDLRGTKDQLTSRLMGLLISCRTKVVVIDEFHHLLSKDNIKVTDAVCEWVKQMMNRTGVAVVISGLESCARIVKTHPELARRFTYEACINPFKFDVTPASPYFNFLSSYAKAMVGEGGLKTAPILTDILLGRQIYVATGGRMSAITSLIFFVLRNALADSRSSIIVDDFSVAWKELSLSTSLTSSNPFSMDTVALKKIIAVTSS